MPSVRQLLELFVNTTSREGLRASVRKSADIVGRRLDGRRWLKRNPVGVSFNDVLFINGCDYSVPHPIRYRVDHQIQQLEAAGVKCGRVEAWDLTLDMIGDARSFVIFRCPYTQKIGEFISAAKALGKRVYFDIDDLVVDTKYTDMIPYLDSMSANERAQYDDGVRRMGQTLMACDGAITSTERLAAELRTMVPEVFVNRNVASEEMVHFSERVIYERDVLPGLSEKDVPSSEKKYWSWACEQADLRRGRGVRIGYFSGSITHNDDFEFILPALVQVMELRTDVHLCVVGELDIPAALGPFKDRIDFLPFCDWKELPRLIADVDINIAPLTRTVFNEAKSENKWIEAALVKVPTVASDIGAFAQMVEHGKTGMLCSDVNEWRDVLLELVDKPDLRREVASNAYAWCHEHATTIGTGYALADYLRGRQSKNCFFILPSLNISGGVLVALRHATLLQDAGYDVTLVDDSCTFKGKEVVCLGHRLPVKMLRSSQNKDDVCLLRGSIDQGIATMWTTLYMLLDYPNIKKVDYLVQNYEPDFYAPTDGSRIPSSATYGRQDVTYLTISRWCDSWLHDRCRRKTRYAPNGIDCDDFFPSDRAWGEGKTRILIEGDSNVSYKNVDEAFQIVSKLDLSHYEIWYMSYNGSPKDYYHVDKFLHKIPHEHVADIYRSCHILLKTSKLESFSYPPLEMMATGGAVVVARNEGNAEYVEDGINCLAYQLGDIDGAVSCIKRIVSDANLRERLRQGGIATAQSRDWKVLTPRILDLYR